MKVLLRVVVSLLAAAALQSQAEAQILGTAENFAVLGGQSVTNTGPSIVNGDLGVWPGTSITGFPPGTVVNGITHNNDAVAMQAQSDVTTAYNSLAGMAFNANLSTMDLGGMTLTPGVYFFSSSAFLTGTLTLDAQGDPNALFVFQIGSELITASGSIVTTINGASGCNVYWQVGSSATLGTTTAFQGNILALTSIMMDTGATILHGRALARNGSVTMQSNTVTGDCIPGVGPPACDIDCPPNIGPVAAGLDSCCASVEFDVALPTVPGCTGATLQCTIIDDMGAAVPITSPYCFPVGTNTVTCTVLDAAGGVVDVCAFIVLVIDDQPPEIACTLDLEQSNDLGLCGAEVTFITGVSDNCDPLPSLACTISDGAGGQISVMSGSFFPVGNTTVTCIATDAAGNTSEPCSFIITVNDTEIPSAVCVQLGEIEVNTCDPIVLTIDDVLVGGLAGITDNCCTDGFIVEFAPTTFECPPLGVPQVINVTVEDCNGNIFTCAGSIVFTGVDCNGNGFADICDICSGFSLDCNDNWVPDECECYWCQGDLGNFRIPVPDENAQLSHEGGGAPNGARVADDFYLEPGCVHRITAFRARVLNNSQPQLRKARLDFYDDCNGKPADEPFATFLSTEHATIIDVQPAIDGFSLLTYRFDLCDECLILDGGKAYWVSIVGITDNINNDLTYWVATDPAQQILGSVPVKADGTRISWTEYVYGDWMHIDECCIGCVNFEFCLDGFACPIIWDNGKPDLGPGRGGSPSGGHQAYDQRTADSMVVKTCEEAPLCYIEAWIWSNCEPLHGFIEVYRDLPCGPPELELLPFRIYSGDEIDAKKFEETWVYNNKTLNLWRLVVKDPDLTLLPGTNYWFSAGAYSTGNFATQSYFANAAPGCDPCTTPHTFKITPGQVRSLRPPATEWAAVVPARDFAFRIAKQGNNVLADSNDIDPDDGDGNATPACLADSNTDGNITVDDIFFFLSAWFNGCP